MPWYVAFKVLVESSLQSFTTRELSQVQVVIKRMYDITLAISRIFWQIFLMIIWVQNIT